MTRKVEESIQAVKTPLEFAKKDFTAWLESIKSGIPKYSHFGTNWSIKLPKDVAEPDIKKEIFFYENCTYCYSQIYVGKDKTPTVVIKKLVNGIPFKVDLQLLISNNRTEEKPVATICIVFKLNNGKQSKPILLDSRAKTKYNDFVHATNKSNNRLQFNLDDESFILLMEKINKQKADTTLVFKNAGNVKYQDFKGRLYQNCYISSNGIIEADEDGIVHVDESAIKLDDSYKDKLPKLYLDEIDVKDLLQKFFLQAEQVYRQRFDVFLVLGASAMTIFIDDIWQRYPGFPVIYLYGATKQGKSILQGIISNIFGYSNKNVSMGNSTDNAIAMKCHRANAIPVLINDFDYYKSQGVAFENNIVQFYEGGVREKMYDGVVMNRMPINTTAIFSSNYLPADKPKVFNRILPVYFPENGIETKFIDDKFVNDEKRSRIIAELMKFSKEAILNKISEVENWLLQSKFFNSKDRESNNVAIAYTGLLLLEAISGYKLPNQEAKLKDYCSWYENLFSSENAPVERFLNALPGLVNTSKLKRGIHYHAKIEDRKFLFTFDFANCLRVYNDLAVQGDITRYIDKRMFGTDLASSKYFVKRGNHRFNNAQGQAYAYTLDITSHPVVPYIKVWAQKLDELNNNDSQ